jgi:Flp pilus assembly CpaE family ATPase
MRYLGMFVLLLALSPLAAAGQDQTPRRAERPRIEAAQERRAELEQQVHRQFLARASERLGLDQGQRQQLSQVLESGAEARRQLAQESRQLRMALMQAVRSETTSAADYQQILDRMADLREREQALERREDTAFARFLEPRQRAMLLMMRMQMNEQVRGMRMDRPGAGTGAGPGRPGG